MSRGDPEIIKRFQHLMRQKDLTQSEIAEKLGLSRTYISSIIAGRSDVSGKFLKALAFEGWPVTWMLTGKADQLESVSSEEWKSRAEKAEKKLELLEYHIQRLEELITKSSQTSVKD